jgi:hypothetical protein
MMWYEFQGGSKAKPDPSAHDTHKGCRYIWNSPHLPTSPRDQGSPGNHEGGRGARGSDLKCSETPCGSRGDGQGVASVPGKEVAQ